MNTTVATSAIALVEQLDLLQASGPRQIKVGQFKRHAFVGPVRRGCTSWSQPDPSSPVSLGLDRWLKSLRDLEASLRCFS